MADITKTVTPAEAKAHLSDCIRSIERGETIVITRHGKPVAALVASDDLEALTRPRAAGPRSGLAGLAGGWEGSDELVRKIAGHRRTRPRRLPPLD